MGRDVFQKAGAALAALGINLVPAGGWFLESWSGGTVLVIYWFENILASLLIAVRILLHRRLHPCRGHFHYGAKPEGRQRATGSFLSHFLPTSLVFSAAHGIFLGVILFALTANGHGAEVGVDWANVRQGILLVVGFLLLDLVADAPGLRQRPFRWVESLAERNFSRVMAVHLAIIIGMAAVPFTGANRAFFGAFLVLKSMVDLSSVIPQWEPERPPAWLCGLLNRVPNAQRGRRGAPGKAETFEEFWAADREAEANRKAANERPCAPGG